MLRLSEATLTMKHVMERTPTKSTPTTWLPERRSVRIQAGTALALDDSKVYSMRLVHRRQQGSEPLMHIRQYHTQIRHTRTYGAVVAPSICIFTTVLLRVQNLFYGQRPWRTHIACSDRAVSELFSSGASDFETRCIC